MKLIDKDALVAEIDALQEATMDKNRNFLSSYDEGKFDALTALEYFLNTLEVKEVREETVNEDLEEAAEEYAPDFSNSIASKAAVDAIRNAFKAGAQWQALHSLETIKGMEEQAFLSGVEAEQINKSFSKEELLNRWRNKL